MNVKCPNETVYYNKKTTTVTLCLKVAHKIDITSIMDMKKSMNVNDCCHAVSLIMSDLIMRCLSYYNLTSTETLISLLTT